MNILLIFLIKLVYSYEFSFSNLNKFGNKFLVNKELDKIILSNEKITFECFEYDSEWRDDFINLYCKKKNIKLLNLEYDNFMSNKIKSDHDVLYIKDFLVKDGRILKDNEIDKLLNYNKLLILGCDQLSTVPLKDRNFLSNFKNLKLDKIEKKEIMHYIYSLIDYYNYNDKLMMINWNKYNINFLNFGKVEKYFYLINVYIMLNKCLNKSIILDNILHNLLNI